MQDDPSMNDGNVVCRNGLHFDENDASNIRFNEKLSISQDQILGTNFETQEMSINDSFFIPLEECVKSIGSKYIVTQERQADVPLVSTQVTHIQGIIYPSLEICKPPPPIIPLEHVALISSHHLLIHHVL